MAKPVSALEGIRVVDVSRFQAGPRCGLMLARMGAEVIKIEKLGGDEGRHFPPMVRGDSIYWAQYNSGKKSLALNLYHEAGKEILRRLVRVSDFFIQNFQPGVIAEMGFGYPVLRELNPKIIMVNVSAYGQYGPYRDRPGFDTIGQAVSGHMSLTGFPENPPTVAYAPIIDRITSLHATIAALGALRERELSGEGQAIEVCLADTGYTLMEIPIAAYLEGAPVPKRHGNRMGLGPSNSFQAQDGWVYIIAPSDNTFKRLCQVVGKPEWAQDPDFVHPTRRLRKRDLIEGEIAKWIAGHTVAEAVDIMSAADIPIAPVNDVPTAARDPHLQERELLMRVPAPNAGQLPVAGKMVKFSRSEVVVGPIPAPGEHNREILSHILGYSEDEIARLQQEGVI